MRKVFGLALCSLLLLSSAAAQVCDELVTNQPGVTVQDFSPTGIRLGLPNGNTCVVTPAFKLTEESGGVTPIDAVANPSFELPILADGGYVAGEPTTIPGWTVGCAYPGCAENLYNSGVWNPPTSVFPNAASNGENVAFVNQSAVYQVLNLQVEAGKTYQILVDVGQRPDMTPTGYEVELYIGPNHAAGGDNLVPLVSGEFVTIALSYTATADDVGQQFLLWLRSFSSQTIFDNVRVNILE